MYIKSVNRSGSRLAYLLKKLKIEMNYYEIYEHIFARAKNDNELMDCFENFYDEYIEDLEENKENLIFTTGLQQHYKEIVGRIEEKYASRSAVIKTYIELKLKA